MDRTYLNNGEYRVASELRMVDRELPEPNRSYAIGYKEYLELNNRKGKTIARRLGELRFILKSLSKDARQADRKDIEKVVMAINKGKRRDQNGKGTEIDLASITKRKLKQNLRSFYKWLYGKDEYPDIVKWVKVGTEVKNKLPEEMLSEEEIKKLIEVCRNQRDKTLIALLWDTGMRIGELLNLKIKDISLTESISHVRVSGKTGDRQVPLVFSVPYFAHYLNDLRKNAHENEPLFTVMEHNTTSNTPIDYIHIRKLLHDLRERANFQKRLYPHLFRHSRATFYANSLTEQQAKMYFGWSGGSTMVARYTHLSGRDINNAILKANGILVDEKGELLQPKPAVKQCAKCNEKNEITAKYCIRCGTPLDKKIIEDTLDIDFKDKELSKIKDALGLLIANLDPETRDKVMKLVKN